MSSAVYIIYQCSVCHRKKDILKDNRRAAPNQCTITKGCEGRLFNIGETITPEMIAPMPGLEEWYPRGQTKKNVQNVRPQETIFSLSSSNSGAMAVAVLEFQSIMPTTLEIRLAQRRTEDVAYRQYTFKTKTASSVRIEGRDQNGKNMRFDQEAILEDRVFVRVNGIQISTMTMTPNRIELAESAPINTLVDVIIYDERSIIEKTITLIRNKSMVPSSSRGAWNNIDYVIKKTVTGDLKYFIYTIDSSASIGIGRAKITSIEPAAEAMILLSSPPHASVDRYLNFVIPISNLMFDYYLISTSTGYITDKPIVNEMYPPLQLVPGNNLSFIEPDEFVETITPNSGESIEPKLVSKTILGPL